MKRDDGLTAKEATRLLLDQAWEELTEREAEKRALKINDLADLALETDTSGREC